MAQFVQTHSGERPCSTKATSTKRSMMERSAQFGDARGTGANTQQYTTY